MSSSLEYERWLPGRPTSAKIAALTCRCLFVPRPPKRPAHRNESPTERGDNLTQLQGKPGCPEFGWQGSWVTMWLREVRAAGVGQERLYSQVADSGRSMTRSTLFGRSILSERDVQRRQ